MDMSAILHDWWSRTQKPKERNTNFIATTPRSQWNLTDKYFYIIILVHLMIVSPIGFCGFCHYALYLFLQLGNYDNEILSIQQQCLLLGPVSRVRREPLQQLGCSSGQDEGHLLLLCCWYFKFLQIIPNNFFLQTLPLTFPPTRSVQFEIDIMFHSSFLNRLTGRHFVFSDIYSWEHYLR